MKTFTDEELAAHDEAVRAQLLARVAMLQQILADWMRQFEKHGWGFVDINVEALAVWDRFRAALAGTSDAEKWLVDERARVRREAEQAFYGGLALALGVPFDVDSVGSSIVEKIRAALRAAALEAAVDAIRIMIPNDDRFDEGVRQSIKRIRALATPTPAANMEPAALVAPTPGTGTPGSVLLRPAPAPSAAVISPSGFVPLPVDHWHLCQHDRLKRDCPDCGGAR